MPRPDANTVPRHLEEQHPHSRRYAELDHGFHLPRFSAATSPGSLLDSQSDCLMEVELNIRPVMTSESKAPATALAFVRIHLMRLPESDTMKLCVPVNVRTAPVLSKPAPMPLPPRSC